MDAIIDGGMIRLGLVGMAFLLAFGAPAVRAQTVLLTVTAGDPLPGFRQDAVAPYLAARMQATYLAGWDFAAGDVTAPDRLEWRFHPDPYAAGTVRRYFPQAQVQRLFGDRHLVSAELRLYRGGQYQTMLFGQAAIQGGASDPDLVELVKKLTQQMLAPGGALDAIEQGARP